MRPRTASIIHLTVLLVVATTCLSRVAIADDGSFSSGRQDQKKDSGPKPPPPPVPLGSWQVKPASEVKVQSPQPPRPAAAPGDGAKPADQKPAAQKPPAPVRIKVTRFKFSGNTLIPTGELEAAVAGMVGHECTFSDLQRAADMVTDVYHHHGFNLARAMLPQQDIRDGVVEIVVIEGKLGQVVVEGNRTYPGCFIASRLGDAMCCGVVSEERLERELLLLNDFPDLKVNARLSPGRAPGTTDIFAHVEDRAFPLTGSLDYDNFGSPSTGRNRIGFGMDWEAVPLVCGSDLALRGVIGDEGDNFDYFRGAYTMPFCCDTKVSLYGFWGTFDVSQVFSKLGISGESYGGGISVAYPWIRQSEMSLSTEFGFEANDTSLDMLDETSSRDRIRKLWLSGNFDNLCWCGHNYVTLTVSQGLGGFIDGSTDDDETDRRNADDSFTKFNLTVSRIQCVCDRVSVLFRAQGQLTDESLMAPEQLQIGGNDTVRGHVQGTASGDDGYTVSLEPRVTVCRDLWYVPQFAAFIDHGGVHNRTQLAGEASWEHLTGTGVGVRWECPCYNIHVRFDVAWPICGDAGQSRDPEYYLSGGIRF